MARRRSQGLVLEKRHGVLGEMRDGAAAPTVSIVMAAYNAARHIEASITSALAQTWSDLELLVVDDGSTDGTSDIVSSIADNRIRLVKQRNSGQSAALNRGVAESHGRLIKFLDADDVLNSRHIESQMAALGAGEDSIASCRWGYFVEDPQLVIPRDERTNRDYVEPIEWLIDSLSLDEGMMGGWKWLIPRRVFDRAGGWNESLSLNNDFDFSVRTVLASRSVRFAGDALYAYRKGASGALSASRSAQAMQSAFDTTAAGCGSLLAREDSPRVRRACADRWQWWLFHFYPDFPDLAARAESEVERLGGSGKRLEGGRLLEMLMPLLGWKGVRRLQASVYRAGWGGVLRWKEQKRLRQLSRELTRT
jgi:glycosyltransferase involved in cell wall biosynthesis